MRYLQIALVLCLMLATNSYAAQLFYDLEVSGSNDPVVNGTYTLDTTLFDSRRTWVKGDITILWGPNLMSNGWTIMNKNTWNYYYVNEADTQVPDETGWLCSYNAISPCVPPVVKEIIPSDPWPMFLPAIIGGDIQ